MSAFLTQRIRDIQGWLPPTDVDGLEVHRQKLFTEQSENIVYENGFWRNVKKPAVISYPLNIANDILGDWSMYSVYHFIHQTKGTVWFYMLNDSANNLKFYVKDADNPDGLELKIFDDKIVIPASLPVELNYFVVDNQLKINMNITAPYINNDTTDVYLNLTLVFLEDVGGPGVFPDRTASWYLTPRWLGWSYFDDRVVFGDTSPSNIAINYLNFTNYENHLVTVSGSNMRFPPGAYVAIENTKAVGGVVIFQVSGAAGQNLQIFVSDGSPAGDPDEFYLFNSYEPNAVTNGNYENEWKALFPQGSFLTVRADNNNVSDLIVNTITFEALNTNTVILASAEDGQVMPVRSYSIGRFPIEDWQTLNVPIDDWDFRIQPGDLWAYIDDGTGILKGYDLNPLNITAGDPGYMNIELRVWYPKFEDHPLVSSPTTLNFTYGLGYDVKPFHEEYSDDVIPKLDSRGDLIYMEVTFRGREYYVRDDFRIYLSHINGAGLLQPDSFPYDESSKFGFITTEYEFEVMRGLAVTSLEELLVLSSANNYVYTIQLGQNIIYRKIKAMNGSSGINSRKSLLRDQRGTTVTSALSWCDKNGIYAYAGGIQEPVDISLQIEHYWLSNGDADNMVAVYNPELKEMLFSTGNEVLVYETNNNAWNRYVFDSPIKEFIGVIDNQAYFLGENGVTYKITEDTAQEFQGTFITHIDSGYSVGPDGNPAPVNELNDKILQELYVSFRERKAGDVAINIIADGNLINGTTGGIAFSGALEVQNSWTPILIRYHHMQIRFTILSPGLEIKETGYTFSIPSQSPGGLPYRKEGGFGYKSGQEYGL
jgi:hypothetical protein